MITAGVACSGSDGAARPSDRPPGGLRIDGLAQNERSMAVAIHLTPFAGLLFLPLVLTPLVLWLVGRERSAFVDDHGRELINYAISFVLLHVILGLTIIGIVLLPVLWIVGVVGLIRGAVAAGNGEYFRYPMTFRFLS